MRKKYVFKTVISLLIISNLITIYFYKRKSNEYEHNLKYSVQNIYLLKGENTNWKLKDGILLLSRNKRYFNGGLLEYVGNKSLNVNYLEINITTKGKDKKVKNHLDSVIHKVMDNADINILNDTKIDLGHASETSSKPIELNLEDDIYVNIQYTTTDNKNHTEEFRLKGKSMDLSKGENISISIF
ncbi:hypothetical protein OW763_14555 [Clostridium aestuarii]|uniref:Uncharacterized protein n=1 Tax=Clostridium aestuarii TaxID=338193 RepID=A0ABT4D2T5_9CLOT|nr:hypothetical protein [Clostridium aestuarii]MCY6485553.1 hypothetical protein [Clostridium aestuarii]